LSTKKTTKKCPNGNEAQKSLGVTSWIDEDRDKVSPGFLELNRIRAEEEAQSAAAAPAARTAGRRGRKTTKIAPVANHNLFDVQESTE